jgi:DNA-binding transcriptional LysR family regulator
MENFRLKVFRTVAEKQSFRRAAETLYLSQPAVTLQVKALEDELGLQLFDRSCKAIQLTNAGKQLLEYAQKMAVLANTARQQLAQFGAGEKHKLKIGVSTTIAQYFLFKFIPIFQTSNPDVQFHIFSGNTDVVVQDLLEGFSSLALVEGASRQALLKVEPLVEDEIVAIASVRRSSTKDTISLDELTKLPLIFREHGSGTRRVVEAALRSAGARLKELNVLMQMNSTEAIKAAVEAGLGIGFVSRRAIEKELRLDLVRELAIEGVRFRRDFSILYPRGPQLTGLAGDFLNFLRQIRQMETSGNNHKQSSSRIKTTDVAFA